jgi:hypothetical protein
MKLIIAMISLSIFTATGSTTERFGGGEAIINNMSSYSAKDLSVEVQVDCERKQMTGPSADKPIPSEERVSCGHNGLRGTIEQLGDNRLFIQVPAIGLDPDKFSLKHTTYPIRVFIRTPKKTETFGIFGSERKQPKEVQDFGEFTLISIPSGAVSFSMKDGSDVGDWLKSTFQEKVRICVNVLQEEAQLFNNCEWISGPIEMKLPAMNLFSHGSPDEEKYKISVTAVYGDRGIYADDTTIIRNEYSGMPLDPKFLEQLNIVFDPSFKPTL